MKFLKSIYRKLQGVREKIRRQYYKEKRKSYGKENPEKTFYVIRRKDSYIGCGLFSHVITTVANIKFAIEKGYIPVVDMMDYPNLYISKKELHKVNAWEYFFEQPCGYDISDIKNSKNVILSDGGIMENRPDAIATDELECWKTVFDKYVLLKPQVRETMDTEWSSYRYLRGLEYLTSIYMLSKCTGLIAGQCGGTTGAMLFNNKYEDLFIWDLGTY